MLSLRVAGQFFILEDTHVTLILTIDGRTFNCNYCLSIEIIKIIRTQYVIPTTRTY
jgi:hypothetical protein